MSDCVVCIKCQEQNEYVSNFVVCNAVYQVSSNRYTGVTLCTWLPCGYVPVSPLPEKTFDSHPKIPGY